MGFVCMRVYSYVGESAVMLPLLLSACVYVPLSSWYFSCIVSIPVVAYGVVLFVCKLCSCLAAFSEVWCGELFGWYDSFGFWCPPWLTELCCSELLMWYDSFDVLPSITAEWTLRYADLSVFLTLFIVNMWWSVHRGIDLSTYDVGMCWYANPRNCSSAFVVRFRWGCRLCLLVIILRGRRIKCLRFACRFGTWFVMRNYRLYGYVLDFSYAFYCPNGDFPGCDSAFFLCVQTITGLRIVAIGASTGHTFFNMMTVDGLLVIVRL